MFSFLVCLFLADAWSGWRINVFWTAYGRFQRGGPECQLSQCCSSDVQRELEGQASEQERLAAEDLSASSALFLPVFPAYLRQQEETVILQDS